MSATDSRSGNEIPFRLYAQQLEKLPPCQAMCPNSGDIRGWLGIIAQREKNGLTLDEAYDRAWQLLVTFNPLPATIGRICPHPCEKLCSRNDKDGAVSINAMERFLGDWGIERELKLPRSEKRARGESIGVVGSGPASLSFAYQMARRGYPVTVYEREDVPGGMLRHAIPDYRLPRTVLDAEVARIFDFGVTLVRGAEFGETLSLGALRERHALLFLGMGAQGARRLGIPGEAGSVVYTGIEFLRRAKAGDAPHCGRYVIVIGGGNTAIDAARSARRLGAAVTLLYRRSEAEMPAEPKEISDARAEGVKFVFLVAPLELIRHDGDMRFVRTQAMRLAEPDQEGRRRPEPIAGQCQEFPADTVIVAVSQEPEWRGDGTALEPGAWIETDGDGRVDADLWAGGDDRGPGIASRAIAHGRHAAESAHATLRGKVPEARPRALLDGGTVRHDFYEERARTQGPRRPQASWLDEPDEEIDLTLDYEQAAEEAGRCLSCGLCFDCRQCFMYCNADGFSRIERTAPGDYFQMALEACEGCGKCIELCPCGYLDERKESS